MKTKILRILAVATVLAIPATALAAESGLLGAACSWCPFGCC